MPRSNVTYTPSGTRGMTVQVRTGKGWLLEATGGLDEAMPAFSGQAELEGNLVLRTNLWAYACQEKERRLTRQEEKCAAFAKQAELHADLVRHTADLIECGSKISRRGNCSACFVMTTHHKVDARLSMPTYLCAECGAATMTCVAPGCDNMATRGFGQVRLPRYCAEHRHDIRSFERATGRLREVSDDEEFLTYARPNLARTTKLVGSGLVLAGAMTGVGLAAAPLVGGVVGTMVGGYSGAAATSYGLALLGGGSVAAGGFGMAGGTAVVAAVGGALGGAMGAGVTNAYVREDKSFRIEKLKDGSGVPVAVCSGFLTEGKTGWGDWQQIVTQRYPDSPVYRVHWGAEDLNDLTAALTGNFGKATVGLAVKSLAMKASKTAAKKSSPLTAGFIVVDLVKNPWFRARQRANKTGAIVADRVARTEIDEIVLVGHSLGARAMICAAEALGTKPSAPTVREVHLLGAAIGANGDWTRLQRAVSGTVFNYHSRNDHVLRFFYSVAQGGQPAAGHVGMRTSLKGIRNVDVSRDVPDHQQYCKRVVLK